MYASNEAMDLEEVVNFQAGRSVATNLLLHRGIVQIDADKHKTQALFNQFAVSQSLYILLLY